MLRQKWVRCEKWKFLVPSSSRSFSYGRMDGSSRASPGRFPPNLFESNILICLSVLCCILISNLAFYWASKSISSYSVFLGKLGQKCCCQAPSQVKSLYFLRLLSLKVIRSLSINLVISLSQRQSYWRSASVQNFPKLQSQVPTWNRQKLPIEWAPPDITLTLRWKRLKRLKSLLGSLSSYLLSPVLGERATLFLRKCSPQITLRWKRLKRLKRLLGSLSNYLLSLVLGERATLFPQKCFTADQRKGHRIQSFEVQAILLRVVSVSVYLSAPINLRRFELFKCEFCRIF